MAKRLLPGGRRGYRRAIVRLGFAMPTVTVRPAVEADCPTILRFVRELAEFENEPHAVKASEADFRRDGWGERPVFEALIAELDGEPVGFALCFRNYSTWEGRAGLFVEDLYVTPEARRYGVGRKLLATVAKLADERGCRRVDLNVLHWNPARDFYLRIGFKQMEEWLPYRLTGDAIAALAAQADEA
ncbi:GNAT family N-acetyltransferase [Azospirillum brasilense]|nr:GNAT family N-acetyltransferase [Azospirillum brasilense]